MTIILQYDRLIFSDIKKDKGRFGEIVPEAIQLAETIPTSFLLSLLLLELFMKKIL